MIIYTHMFDNFYLYIFGLGPLYSQHMILHASGLQLALRARKTRRAMRMGRRWRRVPRWGLSLTTWRSRCDL